MPQAQAKFTVILEPEIDGGYSARCAALPGCVSQGEDRQDALRNIEEAILLVLDSNQPLQLTGTNRSRALTHARSSKLSKAVSYQRSAFSR